MADDRRVLLLCTGLQSSGSTLVSWCFLQRPDADGVLDARNDVLPVIPAVATPYLWLKMTLACFRTDEIADHYRDQGWDVRPLLVARDVRSVFASLVGKHYGANGTTAEEPPLRLRLRRFQADWRRFRENGWPILRYESLVADPEPTLRSACAGLGLPWDETMLAWPKPFEAIAAGGHGNRTFRESRGKNFAETVNRTLAAPRVDAIGRDDLRWLEETFADFNAAHDYPPHLPQQAADEQVPTRAEPSWENTRRYLKSQRPLTKLLAAWSRFKHESILGDSRRTRRLQGD